MAQMDKCVFPGAKRTSEVSYRYELMPAIFPALSIPTGLRISAAAHSLTALQFLACVWF